MASCDRPWTFSWSAGLAHPSGCVALFVFCDADWNLTAHYRDEPEHALELTKAGDDVRALAQVQNVLGILARSQGDLSLARHHQAALHNNLADLFHAADEPEAAMAHLKQAAAILADFGQDADDWQPEIWKLVEW
jgi:hypothetical protein